MTTYQQRNGAHRFRKLRATVFLFSAVFALSLGSIESRAGALIPATLTGPDNVAHGIQLQAISVKQNGFNKIILALASPLKEVSSAQLEIDGSSVQVELRKAKSSIFLLLPSSHGTLSLNAPGQTNVRYSYVTKATKPILLVQSDCAKFKAQLNISNPKLSAYPGMISCKSEGSVLKQVMFSTTEDSNWFGSNLFESDGKGERWKIFEGKDLSSTKGWTFTWGQAESRNVASIKFQQTLEGEKPKLPPFTFWVGGAYFSSSVTTNLASSSAKGLQIPVGVRYVPGSSRFFLSAEYSLFAYSVSGQNSISTMDIHAGYAPELGRLDASFAIGYRDDSLSFKSVNVTSSLAAPTVSAELGLNLNSSTTGIFATIVKSSGSDNYSETDYGIFLDQKSWIGKGVRFNLELQNLSATAGTASLSIKDLRFSTLFEF